MANLDELKRRMQKAIEALKHEFSGLRTGRASTALLDTIKVDAYGAMMPINQIASVSAPEPRMLTVNVWDRGLAGAVDKAIREAGLGLNPISEGQSIRIPMPQLSEERRKELTKVAGKASEDAKVAVRNIRRDGMDQVKKDKTLSEDAVHGESDKIQKLTDEFIATIDKELEAKVKDILTV